MARWLIAASDFVTTGGMDIANWHLARWLAQSAPVELVSHRVDPDLAKLPNMTVTTVNRPWNMNMLGEPRLRRTAFARARDYAPPNRIIANGGNYPTSDINWVHYVHAAFEPVTAGSLLRRLKTRYHHRQCCRTEKAAFEAAKVIICNSKLSATQITKHIGIAADKMRVVYYGSDKDVLKPITPEDRREARAMLGWEERPWAIFIGALGDRRKGFDVLYAAWRALCSEASWDVNLAIVGRGAELAAWQHRAAEDSLTDRMHFLGFRDDVPKVLAACDVMVHPARYEAYGLGVHEAVARGLPAIVSAAAGVSERLAGTLDDLLLANPEDAADLEAKLRLWRRSHDEYHSRTAPLAEKIRSYTWDDMARDFHSAVQC